MATGDRVRTHWQYQHEIIEAAQEKGWEVARVDRLGVTLEEPMRHGIILTIGGRTVDYPAFIRTLPEARLPDEHVEPDVTNTRSEA